jgi:hypothetical protein
MKPLHAPADEPLYTFPADAAPTLTPLYAQALRVVITRYFDATSPLTLNAEEEQAMRAFLEDIETEADERVQQERRVADAARRGMN